MLAGPTHVRIPNPTPGGQERKRGRREQGHALCARVEPSNFIDPFGPPRTPRGWNRAKKVRVPLFPVSHYHTKLAYARFQYGLNTWERSWFNERDSSFIINFWKSQVLSHIELSAAFFKLEKSVQIVSKPSIRSFARKVHVSLLLNYEGMIARD